MALVVAASLVVGRALLLLAGRPEPWTLAGPVGLAALLTLAGIAIHLPGRATTTAILLTAATAAALAAALATAATAPSRAETDLTHRIGGRNRFRGVGGPVLAALIALLAASIPFAASGRFGILGVGLVNDDMASHLAIADWLWTHVGQEPALIGQGYPLGPHALAAALASGAGVSLIAAFAGITLAAPALMALAAYGALAGLRPAARVVAAAAVALPYLGAAYLAQGAFKEPIMALLALGFALLLPGARSPRAAAPLGLIAAGTIYVYSFPGLAWLAGTAALWGALGVARSRRRPAARPVAAVALAAIAVAAVLALPDAGRIADFTGFRAFSSATISGGLGNLRHQLSPLEALGIWPASDFRLSAADASAPQAAFYLGALLAACALVLGLPGWLRRRGPAVPAALAAAAAIYLGARLLGTVYTSAKALAIASPLVVIVALGGLGASPARLWRAALAAALVAGIGLSDLLILRQAPVAPSDHREQLAALRTLVQGRRVLFLGRDNFVAWELRGARPFTAVRNYYDPDYVRPDRRLADVFQKFDFDSVRPRTLARFPYVITTSAAYASGPPPSFEPVRRTADFVLWRRTAPVGERRTLAEGASPGATLDCGRRAGGRLAAAPGTATVFARPPIAGAAWSPGPTVESGSPASQELRVPAGRWAVSLQYDATQPLSVSAPGLRATLPANLDYRGSVPYYPAGILRARRPGPLTVRVAVESPPLAGRLLGASSEAHLGAIALSPAGSGPALPGAAERAIPLRAACGRYVDWYARGSRSRH